MVLPVEGAVVTLAAVVLAVAVVEGLVVDDVGLDAVDAGRDVGGPVAGLGGGGGKQIFQVTYKH